MDAAFFLGMVLGEAVDPLIAALGFLIGFVATRWWIRIVGSCLIGSGLSLVAAYVDPIAPYYHEWGAKTASSIGGALLWACLGWAVVVAKRKMTRRQSSSGSS